MTNEELQKMGAEARARGNDQMMNPYYRKENMPASTGEPASEYARKVEQWDFGWMMEDAIRS